MIEELFFMSTKDLIRKKCQPIKNIKIYYIQKQFLNQ